MQASSEGIQPLLPARCAGRGGETNQREPMTCDNADNIEE